MRIFVLNRIGIVYTELALPPESAISLIPAIIDYARIKGVDSIVGLTGIAKPNRLDLQELTTYYISSLGRVESIEKTGVKALENGVLVGPYAVLLKEALRRRLMRSSASNRIVYGVPRP